MIMMGVKSINKSYIPANSNVFMHMLGEKKLSLISRIVYKWHGDMSIPYTTSEHGTPASSGITASKPMLLAHTSHNNQMYLMYLDSIVSKYKSKCSIIPVLI